MRRLASFVLAPSILFFVTLAACDLAAAPPQINQVTPRGLRIGGVTNLVVEGADLLPTARLLLPGVDVQATASADSTPQRVQFQVTLPDTVVPGIVGLRLGNAHGVSNLVPVGLDRLEQKPFADSQATLPAALHGQLSGDQRLRTRFQGVPGQRIVADVESQRLGGALRPVVRLYDSRDVQLAWSGPRADLAGDARLEFTLSAAGEYVIEVHDVLFRASAPGFFRLKIGDLHGNASPFPAGIARGATATIDWLRGGYPPGTRTSATAQVPEGARHLLLAPPPATLYTGHAASVTVSDFPEATESRADPGSAMTLGKAPIAVSGRLAAAKEEDRYELSVTPGSVLRIECFAQRLGSPLDGVLAVLGPQGNGLANSDDRPGTSDPGLDFTVPAGVERVILSLRDLQHRGGPEYVYRLSIVDLARPDVTATVDIDRLQIPAGSTQLLPIKVTRQSYAGALTLAIENLPANVRAAGLQIAPDATVGLISLSADAPAPSAPASTLETASVSLGRILVKGGEGATAFTQAAQFPDSPQVRLRPWERASFAVGVAQMGPLSIDWAEVSADEKLPAGGKIAWKLKVTRAAGTTGTIRLRLATSQVIPKKTVKQNNMDVQVDDTDRALRLEGEPTVAADANESTVQLLVPADLTPGPWSLAVVAELLGADNKAVVASAATPVRVLSRAN